MLNEESEVLMETRILEQDQPVGGGTGPPSRARRSAGTDHQEIEWQFDAPDGLEKVEEWLGGRGDGSEEPGVFVAGGSTKELVDTYYDTGDWRLYRAGYALRVRKTGGRSEATMKALSPGGEGAIRRRREISEPLRGDGVDALLSKKRPGPVGERLKALAGARKLSPLFEVRTRRRTFDLLEERPGGADGSPDEIVQDASGNIRRKGSRAGEVTLDESEIPAEDEVSRLSRVEVEAEASAGGSPGLERFVEVMEGALHLRPAETSKYEAGLRAAGRSPRAKLDLGPDSVDKSLSVGEVAFAVLRRQFAVMRAHEPGTRLGEDPEELHDMRVATRRLRAAIKLFEDALPAEARAPRDELKWIAGAMGDVRDLDVQIEQLEEQEIEGDREPLLKIVAALEKRRSEARVRLLETLDSDRYERLESSFAGMLRRGAEEPGESPMAGEPILDAAPDLLSRPYRKWRKAAKRIRDGSSDPEEYHDLRKKGKRLRYALEFLSDVYGDETERLVKPLKKLQDGLGNHQDLIVAGDLLEELATHEQRLPRRAVFTMGALAGRHRQQAADLRASLPSSKAYRKLLKKGKAWKRFEKAMKKSANKEKR